MVQHLVMQIFLINRSGLVCRVNNGATIEEHHEFWILVAGQELEWKEYDENVNNRVIIPGSVDNDNIGKHNNNIGTVTGEKLFSVIEDKRSKSAVHRGSGLIEQQFLSREFDKNFMILAYAYPSPLKSLCRRIIKKNI